MIELKQIPILSASASIFIIAIALVVLLFWGGYLNYLHNVSIGVIVPEETKIDNNVTTANTSHDQYKSRKAQSHRSSILPSIINNSDPHDYAIYDDSDLLGSHDTEN